MFGQDEKRQCSFGVHGCIQEPLDEKGYGSVKAKSVNAPFAEHSPLVFECRITDRKKKVYGFIHQQKFLPRLSILSHIRVL